VDIVSFHDGGSFQKKKPQAPSACGFLNDWVLINGAQADSGVRKNKPPNNIEWLPTLLS
jgi:hypothetical protein